MTLGQYSGAHTINLGTGNNTAGTKTINIGTNGSGSSTTVINMGTQGNVNTITIGSSSSSVSNTTLNGTIIMPRTATPASATATGTTGTIVWDADYIYVCTATNQWKRVLISTW